MRKFLRKVYQTIGDAVTWVVEHILLYAFIFSAVVFFGISIFSVIHSYQSEMEKPAIVLTFYQEESGIDGRRQASLYYSADGQGNFIAFDNAANAAEFIRLLEEKYRVVNLSAWTDFLDEGGKDEN